MKRSIRLMLTLTSFLSVTAFFAVSAHARSYPAPSDCKLIQTIPVPTAWPGTDFYACGTAKIADVQATAMGSTAGQLQNSDLFDRMQTVDPRIQQQQPVPPGPGDVRAVFLLYGSPNDAAYKTDFPGAVPANDGAVTNYQVIKETPTAIPEVTIVFEKTGGGSAVSIPNNTMHELGHWADYIYVTATASTDSVASDSAWVKANLTDDQNILNALTQCGSTSALFYNQLDSKNNYICSGTTGQGIGLNTAVYKLDEESYLLQVAAPVGTNPPVPVSVLLQAWPSLVAPGIFTPATHAYNREVFAEALAVWKGDSRTGTLANQNEDNFFLAGNHEFNCLQNYVLMNLITNGTEPTPQAPAPPTGCTKP